MMLSLFGSSEEEKLKPPALTDGTSGADDAAARAVEERCQRQLEELRSALEGTGEEPGLKAAVSSIRQDVDALREALTQQVEELRSSLEQRYAQAEQQVLEAMQLNGRLAEAASESHAHALQVSFRADAQKALLEEAARPVGGMSEEERAALEARLRALEATRGAGVSEQEREGLFARVRALEAQLEEGIEMGMTRTGTTTDGKRNLGVQVRQAVLEINMLDERLNALEAAADSDSAWPVRQELPERVEARIVALEEKLADLGTPTASGGFSFGLGAQDGGDLLTSLRARILALGEEQEEQESRVSRLQEQLEQMKTRLQTGLARTSDSTRRNQDVERSVELLEKEVRRLSEASLPVSSPQRAEPQAEAPPPKVERAPTTAGAGGGAGGGSGMGDEQVKQFLQAQLAENTALRGRIEASVGDKVSKAMQFIRKEREGGIEENRRLRDRLHARVDAVEAKVEEEYMRRLELLRMQFAETAFLRQKAAQLGLAGASQDAFEGYLTRLSRSAEHAVLAEVVESWRAACKQQPSGGAAG